MHYLVQKWLNRLMHIWTKDNIINYSSDLDEANDQKYPKESQVRKLLVRNLAKLLYTELRKKLFQEKQLIRSEKFQFAFFPFLKSFEVHKDMKLR